MSVADHVDDAFVADLAAALIAIPGHEQLPQHERDVAIFLRECLEAEGIHARLVEIGEGRANLLARVGDGDGDGPRLVLCGHLDTVPAYGMPAAFEPRWRAGRLHGRGAVDMKGAVACMAGALVALARAGAPLRGQVVLAGVAGEESGSPGMRHFVATEPPADFAIVGEPTAMDIATAHKGAMWIEVELTGRAAHGSTPELGVNAIEHAAAFVEAVRAELRPRLARRTHPILGRATINVGVIEGGDRPPSVPARCRVALDRRWLPGEKHGAVLGEIDDLLAAMRGRLPQLRWEVREMDATASFVHHPLACPPEAPGIGELEAAIADVAGARPRRFGARFWTDAALLAHTGTPAVVCGPGDIAQAHGAEEYVEEAQLRLATRAYALAASAFLAPDRGREARTS